MIAPEIVRVADVDQIIAFARKLPVFPCSRYTKKPLLQENPDGSTFGPQHGHNSATQDPELIRAWWSHWPDALVGVPMGAKSGGLVTIDYDEYKGDVASANWWQEHAAQLMSARIHQTGRDGKHYLFRTPQRVKSVNGPKLGGITRKAIDVKGDGGYIIWWPFHGRAIVQGEGEEAPTLPGGLIDEVFHVERAAIVPRGTTAPEKWREDRPAIIAALAHLSPDCDRTTWLNTGLELHHHSNGAEDGFTVFHSWSMGGYASEVPGAYTGEADCRKVWDHANVSRGEGNAVRGIGGLFWRAAQNGYRQPSRREASRSNQAGPPPMDEAGPLPGIDYNDDTGEVFNSDSVKAGARERRRAVSNSDRPALPLSVEIEEAPSLADVMTEKVEELPWIYADRIPAGAFLIVARPKLGKSWWSLQLCIQAAMGVDFLGFLSNGPVQTLYFCSEDDNARIQSRKRSLGLDAPQGMKILTREKIEDQARKLAAHMTFPQYVETYLEKFPAVKLVMIDTEAVCMRIWDGENAGSQERSVTKKDYADVDTFAKIAMRRGVFIGLVNHTRKARGGAHGYEDPHEMINRTNTANAGASGSIVFDQPGHNPDEGSSKIVRMSIRGRDVHGDHAFALEQVKGGLFEMRGEWSEFKASAAEAETLDALIEMQAEAPKDWYTAKEIASHLMKPDGGHQGVSKVITRMLKREGGAMRTYKGWRVSVKRGKGVSITRIDPA